MFLDGDEPLQGLCGEFDPHRFHQIDIDWNLMTKRLNITVVLTEEQGRRLSALLQKNGVPADVVASMSEEIGEILNDFDTDIEVVEE